jgi:hypothetical protein
MYAILLKFRRAGTLLEAIPGSVGRAGQFGKASGKCFGKRLPGKRETLPGNSRVAFLARASLPTQFVARK